MAAGDPAVTEGEPQPAEGDRVTAEGDRGTAPNRRERDLLVPIAAAILVAIALLVGVLHWTGAEDPPPGPPPRLAVLEPAQAWLRAWKVDDREAMVELAQVDGQPRTEMLASIGAFRTGLGIAPGATGGDALDVVAGEPVVVDDRATVPFQAIVTMPGIGVWEYGGTLTLQHQQADKKRGVQDVWRPVWEPAALHPRLTATRRFELWTAWPERAALVLADGKAAAGRVSSAILGRVGPATTEQAVALGAPYRVGQSIGVSGLQAAQEKVLAGTPAAEIRLLDGEALVQVLLRVDGTPPAPVRVTLDPRLQALAQSALEAAPEGKLAALVAIRPSTGEVLVEASRPANGFDRALLGRYPPGSTFKVVTTIALLTKGVSPDELVSCPAEAVIGGRKFVNAEGHVLGDIPFRRAFAESCNTAFVQLAQRLTPEELHAAAVSVGFDRDPALGAPAATSSMPVPASAVDLAASAIGQGRVLASPLEMAEVAAAVAVGGYRAPHLVDTGPGIPIVPFAPGVAAAATDLMRQVVSNGTGTLARLAGAPVAGKTGTAEFGTEDPPHTHAWFIAFRGDLAIAVLVEDGGFGGDVAAPIAAAFFRSVG
jgi:hypothetical protein